MYNKLLNGKDPLERIVGLEINDNVAEIFVQKEDGSIHSEIRENRFWILSNKKLTDKAARLEGELHYKWGHQFSDRKSYMIAKSSWGKFHDIYTIANPRESLMVKNGYTFFKNLEFKDVSVLSFDIETTGLTHDNMSKVLLISNTFRDSKGIIKRKLFSYDEYKTDADFIDAWCNWVCECDPSILVTHNGSGYDLPYLSYCADKAGTGINIGRDGSAVSFETWESKFRKDQTQFIHYHRPNVYGREVVDTLFLSIKYDVMKKYESYGLKTIIKQEGLEAEDRVYYDASQIRFKYKDPEEWEKIKQYCIHDSDEALALFDLMAPSYFYLSQSVSKPFQSMIEGATGSMINNIMVRSYLQDKHSIPKADYVEKFKGAISFGRPGIYRNALKWDVASLYPSIMVQYKVYNPDKDPKGYFLQLVDTLRTERLKNKKIAKNTGSKYHNDLQEAQKITINSMYGFLGTAGLNFNFLEGAELITRKGREILKQAIKWATGEDYLEVEESEELEDEVG